MYLFCTVAPDDDRHGAIKNAQKIIGRIMLEKEQYIKRERRNWTHLKSPTRQSVESPLLVSNSGSEEIDKTIASFFYENSITFNVMFLRIHPVLHT